MSGGCLRLIQKIQAPVHFDWDIKVSYETHDYWKAIIGVQIPPFFYPPFIGVF
jgi:hypothetical protein